MRLIDSVPEADEEQEWLDAIAPKWEDEDDVDLSLYIAPITDLDLEIN